MVIMVIAVLVAATSFEDVVVARRYGEHAEQALGNCPARWFWDLEQKTWRYETAGERDARLQPIVLEETAYEIGRTPGEVDEALDRYYGQWDPEEVSGD